MASAPARIRVSWWPWALIASAVTFVVGGTLHPDQDPTLPQAETLPAWIGHPLWVPSHALILAAAVLLVPGLVGLLAARPTLSVGARRAGRVAVVAAVLWAIESVPHLGAASESAAAAAGQGTPMLAAHMVLALLGYPLLGLSVATLAVLGGRALAHPLFTPPAMVGGVAWTLAPWLVGPFRVEGASVLFLGGMFLALWIAAVGAGELARWRAAETGRVAV